MSKEADPTRDTELITLGRMIGHKAFRTHCLETLKPEDFRDKDTRELFRSLKDGQPDELDKLLTEMIGTKGTLEFCERIKAFARAREIAAKLKPRGVYANPQKPEEAEEILQRFLEQFDSIRGLAKDRVETKAESNGQVSPEAQALAQEAIKTKPPQEPQARNGIQT